MGIGSSLTKILCPEKSEGKRNCLLLLGKSSEDLESVEEVLNKMLTQSFDGDFEIIKTCGLVDYETNPRRQKSTIKNIVRSYAMRTLTYFIILSYPIKWTQEERMATEFFAQTLNNDFKECCVLILTNGIDFKEIATSKGTSSKSLEDTYENHFQQYLQNRLNEVDYSVTQHSFETCGHFLDNFFTEKKVEKCNRRCILLDCEGLDDAINKPETELLFEILKTFKTKQTEASQPCVENPEKQAQQNFNTQNVADVDIMPTSQSELPPECYIPG